MPENQYWLIYTGDIIDLPVFFPMTKVWWEAGSWSHESE